MAQPLFQPTGYQWLGLKPSVTVSSVTAEAIAEAVAPTLVWGSTTSTPAAAEAVAEAVAPTVVLGSVSITPAEAIAVAEAIAPDVVAGAITPSAAEAVAEAVAPTVALGSVSVSPAAGEAIAEAVAPAVSIVVPPITPSAAETLAEAVAPTVTITGTAVPVTTHWFLDTRNHGWIRDSFTRPDFDPIAVCSFDGDDPEDRATLMGGGDGYVRYFDTSVSRDDSENMTSTIILGPLTGKDGTVPIVLREVQGVLDGSSESVKYEILSGNEPDESLDTEADPFNGDGTFAAGLGPVHNPRTAGYYLYAKVGTTAAATPWSLEGVRTRSSAIATSRGRHD